MANISLKFPHKTFRIFLLVIVIFVSAIIALDIGGSIVLNRHLRSLQKDVEESAGFRFDVRSAFFEVFSGIRIYDVMLSQGESNLFSAKSVGFNFDLFRLILEKQLYCKKLSVKAPYIYKTEHIDKELIAALLLGLQAQEHALRSTIIKIYDFNIMDLITLDVDGYVAFAKTKLLVTRGKLKMSKAAFLGHDITEKKPLQKRDLNYSFEATFLEDDFLIHKFEVTGYGTANLLVSGNISDFASAVNIEMKGDIRNVLLDDIQRLNSHYFSTRGFAEVAFRIHGPIEKPKSTTRVKISNCNVSFFDSFYVKRIRSDLMWDDNDLSLELSGFVDDSPLHLRLEVDRRNIPQIHSQLSLQELGSFRNVTVNFEGYLLNKIIGGDIEASLDYTQRKIPKRTSIVFRNMYLNFDTKNFLSNSLDMVWINDLSQEVAPPTKTMSLTGLSADVVRKKNTVLLQNVKAALYGGHLQGDVDFMFDKGELLYDAKLYLQNLKIEDFGREFLSLGYQLSGVLSGTVALSSERKKALSGEVQVVNGQVQDNAVLVAVADFFDVPSLRTIDFSKLRINFLKAWDKYRAGINLFSKDVTIYMDNQFFDGGVMDGYLSVRLNSGLMDESSRFRRLFKYIEYKEPTVYFPFNLRGYVENPRLEWLQNEFKEKLGKFLKDKHKKGLQNHLNKVAKDFMK